MQYVDTYGQLTKSSEDNKQLTIHSFTGHEDIDREQKVCIHDQ